MTRRTFFATVAAVLGSPALAAAEPAAYTAEVIYYGDLTRSTFPAWQAHVPASTGAFTRAHMQELSDRCQRPDWLDKAMYEDGRRA